MATTLAFEVFDAERAKKYLSRENLNCPLSKFIGNDLAVKKLQAVALNALQHRHHYCADIAWALFGPASSGKTTLAKLFAETLALPFVEISPKGVKTLDDIVEEISKVCTEKKIPLTPDSDGDYLLPMMVVFIDEIHALNKSIIQGLLKATEYDDCVMITETGKTLLTENVCWIIATTDEGRLFDAFRTRFNNLYLNYLTKEEIAQVIKQRNPDFLLEVCELIAHYNPRSPRKALEFARYMKLLKGMENPLTTWEEIAEEVAKDEGIDEFGMSRTNLRILKALSQGPIPKNRMPYTVGSKLEEVENFVMPFLLTESEEQPALVTVTRAGYTITKAGLAELDKRGIEHPPFEEE